ncbi:MAG: VOC family protein [Dehalococcoidia bacterium]
MIKPKRLGHLVLRVRDVNRSVEFYSQVLGLRVTGRVGDSMAFFSSTEDHHDLAVMGIGEKAPGPEPDRVGLYHFAYQLGSFDELREAYRFLKEKDVNIAGLGDHGATKSLYFFDPDGNEIEVYCDAPEHEGKKLDQLFTETGPLDLEEPAKAG